MSADPTPETPMVTEADAVRRERAAYCEGARDRRRTTCATSETADVYVAVPGARSTVLASASARALYPMPTVTRPRVLIWQNDVGDDIAFRCVGEMVEYRNQTYERSEGAGWEPMWTGGFAVKADLVALWADIVARSVEEVPADAEDAMPPAEHAAAALVLLISRYCDASGEPGPEWTPALEAAVDHLLAIASPDYGSMIRQERRFRPHAFASVAPAAGVPCG